MHRVGIANRTFSRAGGLLLAALVLAPAAHALEEVPGGATVRITKLSKADAYFKQRKEIVGLLCGVEEGGLHPQNAKWYGGSMTCNDGDNYYFYEVAVEVGDFGVDFATLTGHPYGEVAADDAAVFADGSSGWPVGARVRIRDVSSEDAHVDDKGTLVGQACTVRDAALESTGAGWFSGQLKCENGMDLYFYQVGVDAADAPTTTVAAAPVAVAVAPTAPAAAASDFPAGKMVKVVDLAPADALHATKSVLVGRTCSVVESPLHATGDGWYAGRLFCDDGKSYQVFMAKVAAP